MSILHIFNHYAVSVKLDSRCEELTIKSVLEFVSGNFVTMELAMVVSNKADDDFEAIRSLSKLNLLHIWLLGWIWTPSSKDKSFLVPVRDIPH